MAEGEGRLCYAAYKQADTAITVAINPIQILEQDFDGPFTLVFKGVRGNQSKK